MKKIALILVALLMTLASIAIAEKKPTVYTSGDYEYILLDDGTAEINGYTGKSSTVNIPKELDGYSVSSIGNSAFRICPATKLIIPDSVTTIKHGAFALWESLTEITIPESVTFIGASAFTGCNKLSEIIIPDSVTCIGNNPFERCVRLNNIIVSPDHPTLAMIDGVLFDKINKALICYPITLKARSYSIPQGISSIGDRAFAHSSILELTIPNSVTSIGNEAFYDCDFTEFVIPDSITSIGYGAFDDCNELTEITIPDSVISIAGNPFTLCDNLSSITVSPDHPTLAMIDGVLFDKIDKVLICYPITLKARSYSIPQGISSIANGAFVWCDSITKITVPDSLISIGNSAFSCCNSLTEITLPDSVTFIGDEAFIWCDFLKKINISENVTSIGEDAFFGCFNLTITVEKSSYAAQYAKENNINYTYPDSLNWLNS